jgi:hypothetical protein
MLPDLAFDGTAMLMLVSSITVYGTETPSRVTDVAPKK